MVCPSLQSWLLNDPSFWRKQIKSLCLNFCCCNYFLKGNPDFHRHYVRKHSIRIIFFLIKYLLYWDHFLYSEILKNHQLMPKHEKKTRSTCHNSILWLIPTTRMTDSSLIMTHCVSLLWNGWVLVHNWLDVVGKEISGQE